MGSRTAPEPFPPVTPIDTTLSISKFWGSTKASTILPLTLTSAVAPTPTPLAILTLGGFKTS